MPTFLPRMRLSSAMRAIANFAFRALQTFCSIAFPLRASIEYCYQRRLIKRQPVNLVSQHLNHFKLFCDQLHILRKMTFTNEKTLMLLLPVFKA